jgi:nucleoside-diphosphate-sugar epimerase
MSNLSAVESLLITGANGFVGRSVLERLACYQPSDLPKEVILVTRKGIDFELPPALSPITKFVIQDLTKPWVLNFECTHIINLAADGSQSPYSEKAGQDFRLIGRNLIDWLNSRNVQAKVFHASSGACFGYKSVSSERPLDSSKVNFIASRLDVEETLKKSSKTLGFDLSIGRLFTFSGNLLLEKSQYAVTDFIKSGLANGRIHVTGNPETVRSYMHQEAMAEWILQALLNPVGDTTLQIGASEPVTIGELAEFVAEKTGAKVDYAPNPQPGDVYLPDNEKTKTKLGLSEGLNWRLSVQQMIETARRGSNVTN